MQSRSRSPSSGLTRQSTLPGEDASRRLDRTLPAVLSDCVEVGALLTLHCLVCALQRAHVDPLVAGSSASFADLLAFPRKSSTASCASAVTTGTASPTGALDVRQRRDSNQEKRHLLPSVAEPSAPVIRYTCSFKQFLELCLIIKLTCAYTIVVVIIDQQLVYSYGYSIIDACTRNWQRYSTSTFEYSYKCIYAEEILYLVSL